MQMLPPPKKVNNWTIRQNQELKEQVNRLNFELNATYKVSSHQKCNQNLVLDTETHFNFEVLLKMPQLAKR
ncbi:unnamed protein product (macronuclear) [Paramecium tetraurelia]|uniref:Uncharacterized protein n=1 Tax=Paramecium tetraurelia TaxID=5888 RepID=A0D8V7_PARTE|nr:uncharacterized protein GSPATT00014420001 [Paramecium tetraurelia]CAK79474.1 unnamed protein product [Paramecium tetraurelia]|eukprot:XP_001446871.1 hypothetical protein (macronuclear) [Paramecium tetraurelia strain d4-2]